MYYPDFKKSYTDLNKQTELLKLMHEFKKNQLPNQYPLPEQHFTVFVRTTADTKPLNMEQRFGKLG